jgi:hypothetical protein
MTEKEYVPIFFSKVALCDASGVIIPKARIILLHLCMIRGYAADLEIVQILIVV